MNLTRIEGPPTICACSSCVRTGIGGSEAYQSASSGETRTPEDWYQTDCGRIYCAECAAKVVQDDPTRSLTRFYLNTNGSEIDPKVYGH